MRCKSIQIDIEDLCGQTIWALVVFKGQVETIAFNALEERQIKLADVRYIVMQHIVRKSNQSLHPSDLHSLANRVLPSYVWQSDTIHSEMFRYHT